jgi:hypothetical protein
VKVHQVGFNFNFNDIAYLCSAWYQTYVTLKNTVFAFSDRIFTVPPVHCVVHKGSIPGEDRCVICTVSRKYGREEV